MAASKSSRHSFARPSFSQRKSNQNLRGGGKRRLRLEALENRHLLSLTGLVDGLDSLDLDSPFITAEETSSGLYMIRETPQYEPVTAEMIDKVLQQTPTEPQFEAGVGRTKITLIEGPGLLAHASQYAGRPNALTSFHDAVSILEDLFYDPVEVVVDAEFGNMGPYILGGSLSEQFDMDYDYLHGKLLDDANPVEDTIVQQIPDSSNIDLDFPLDPLVPYSFNGMMHITRANAKAIGVPTELMPMTERSDFDPTYFRDMSLTFNNLYMNHFDFDRSDGIAPGAIDFTGVVMHEIIHGLGFISEVDWVDILTFYPEYPELRSMAPATMDLFRMEPGDGEADFAGATRLLTTGDLVPEQVTYDGGVLDYTVVDYPNMTVGDIPMSTGSYNGDGWQASHFKNDRFLPGGLTIGLMDPEAPSGLLSLTEADLRVLTIIGWDTTLVGYEGGITGMVWNDINNNGTLDPSESGLPNETVFLDINNNEQIDYGEPVTETNSEGIYTFESLREGDYVVRTVPKMNWKASNPATASQTVSVPDQEVVTGVNFGIWQPATIRGTVYEDHDGNHSQGAQEDFLEGWTVFIDQNENGELDDFERSVVTGESGEFAFNGLIPGDYQLGLVVQSEWEATDPIDASQVITIGPGEWKRGIRFGARMLPVVIEGMKWNDANANGVKDNGEQGFAGWSIYLDMNENGLFDEGEPTTTTDFDGSYRFEELPPAEYVVAEMPQAGWTQTSPSKTTNTRLVGNLALNGMPNREVVDSDISGNGRFVVFSTKANNLVPQDSNDLMDVFVLDRATGMVERVSVGYNSPNGNGWSASGSISHDGRYVAFHSDASNLVEHDLNDSSDIFVYDRLMKTTKLVSVAEDGTQRDAGIFAPTDRFAPQISGNGQFVVFASESSITAGDMEGAGDDAHSNIYLKNLQTGEVISVTSGANDHSFSPSINTDGSFITFESYATNLTPETDTNAAADVFLYDVAGGTTHLVSGSQTGLQTAGGNSLSPDISGNGQYVAFQSSASDLVEDDVNGMTDIFLYEAATGDVSLMTHGLMGASNGSSSNPAISGDGRFIALESRASNLIDDDRNDAADIFIVDRITDNIQRLSESAGFEEAESRSIRPALSNNGLTTVYLSPAQNLVPDDENVAQDAFTANNVLHPDYYGFHRVALSPGQEVDELDFGGFGHYELPPTVTDLGDVDYQKISSLNPVDGDIAYSLSAVRDGLISFQIDSAVFGNRNAFAMLFDASENLLAAGRRLDWHTSAGEDYYVLVSGSENDVSLSIANLVDFQPKKYEIYGTAGIDQFEFLDMRNGTFKINQMPYAFPQTGSGFTYEFIGSAGDVATVRGTVVNDSAVLARADASFTNGDAIVKVLGASNITFDGLGGEDVATLNDSSQMDTLTFWPHRAIMEGSDYTNSVLNVSRLTGNSSEGGEDSLILYDSEASDQFNLSVEGESTINGVGFFNIASGFFDIHANANNGYDVVHLNGTSGDDSFISRENVALMSGTTADGDSYLMRASFFDSAFAYSQDDQGEDEAVFFDSNEVDHFISRPDFSQMFYNRRKSRVNALDFEFTQVHSSSGGRDTATIFDSNVDDLLAIEEVNEETIKFSTKVYPADGSDPYFEQVLELIAFEQVEAHANNGGINKAEVNKHPTEYEFDFLLYGDWDLDIE